MMTMMMMMCSSLVLLGLIGLSASSSGRSPSSPRMKLSYKGDGLYHMYILVSAYVKVSVFNSEHLCFHVCFQISSSLMALSGLTWSARVVSELSYWTRKGGGCLLELATFCYLSVSTTSANRNRRYSTLLTPYFIHNGSVKENIFPSVLYVSHQLILF